jgi:hypothetical protein
MREFQSQLAHKQLEISYAQAELVQLREHALICPHQQNSPVELSSESVSLSCPPHPHSHDIKIEQHQKALNQLTQTQQHIQQQLDHSRKLLSPILHLPLDLLQHVFTFCLPSQKFFPVFQQSAPLLLTSVNRLFR